MAVLALALGQQRYVAPDSSFSIYFPQGWAVEEGILRSVLVKGMVRDLRDTATVMVSRAVDRVGFAKKTLVEIAELTRQQHECMKYSFVGSGYDSIAGRPTAWIACSIGAAGFTPPRAILVHFFPRDSQVYSVTSTVHPRNYERYLPAFRTIAASFRLSGEFAEAAARRDDPALFSDSSRGFSLVIPPGWLVKPAVTADVVFKVVKQHEGFRSGITVTAVEYSPGESPRDRELDTGAVRALLKNALMSQPQIADLDIRRIEYDVVSNRRAVRAEYTTTYRGQDRMLRRMHQTDLIVLHRNCVLTFGGALGDETDREAFATTIRSVRLYGDTDGRGVTTKPSKVRLVLTPGDRPIPALMKALGSSFLKYFLAFVGLGLAGAIWRAIYRRRNNSGSSDEKTAPP